MRPLNFRKSSSLAIQSLIYMGLRSNAWISANSRYAMTIRLSRSSSSEFR
nr:hypothetical protein GZ27A8_35 [uncultured archaeon GZfos27A8]